jgi:hypothetical protein
MRRRSALAALLAAGSLRCDWVMTVDAELLLVFAGAQGCPKHADASLVVEPALAAGP